MVFHELAGNALDSDAVRRAISAGVYPELPSIFSVLAGDVAVPANTTINLMQGQFNVPATPRSPRDYALQFGIFVVTVLMGATAGRVAVQATSGGVSACVDLAANQIDTLIVYNIGTAPDGANLNELVKVRSTQACTVKALDPVLNLPCTYGYQVEVWQ